MRRLLDTSAAISLRDVDPRITELFAALDATPLMSIITIVELEGGIAHAAQGRDQRRRSFESMLQAFGVLTFGPREARCYGEIVAAIGFSRSKVIDRMIAAQAIVAGAALVTLNPRDFRSIPGLTVEDWSA